LVEYDAADPWDLIEPQLRSRPSCVVLVTDEEPVPRGALRGSSTDLRRVIAGGPFFEYLVTDDDVSFGIFDAHHNDLVHLRPKT